MAIDVFYLTSNGEKLTRGHQRGIHKGLMESLQEES
jgi:hypothetical protein